MVTKRTEEPLGDAPATATGQGRGDSSKPRKKRRPGAPRGNLNHAYLAGSKAKARAQRDRDRRTARRDVRDIIEQYHVEDLADVRVSGKLLVEALTNVSRLSQAAAKAPTRSASGEARGELSRLIESLLRAAGLLKGIVELAASKAGTTGFANISEARKAIDKIARDWPGALVHVITFGGVRMAPGGYPVPADDAQEVPDAAFGRDNRLPPPDPAAVRAVIHAPASVAPVARPEPPTPSSAPLPSPPASVAQEPATPASAPDPPAPEPHPGACECAECCRGETPLETAKRTHPADCACTLCRYRRIPATALPGASA